MQKLLALLVEAIVRSRPAGAHNCSCSRRFSQQPGGGLPIEATDFSTDTGIVLFKWTFSEGEGLLFLQEQLTLWIKRSFKSEAQGISVAPLSSREISCLNRVAPPLSSITCLDQDPTCHLSVRRGRM